MENEIWISPIATTNHKAQDGTPTNPFRCPDAETLANLFASPDLKRNGLCIHFMAGTFQIGNPGLQVLPGWRIKGSGMTTTILMLKANCVESGASVTCLYSDSAEGVEISDLTIDCNYHNQVKPIQVTAISITGSQTRIHRVKAINWGTSGPECFVIGIGNDGTNLYWDCEISECRITQPAPVVFGGGVSALVIFTSNGNGTGNIRGAVFRNNVIYGVVTGLTTPGSPRYFNGIQDAAGGMAIGNLFMDLTGSASYCCYRDSWNGVNAFFTDNMMDNVTGGIFFNLTDEHMKGLVIINNCIRPTEGGFGINLYPGQPDNHNPDAWFSNVVCKGNIIYPAEGANNIRTILTVPERTTATLSDNTQFTSQPPRPQV